MPVSFVGDGGAGPAGRRSRLREVIGRASGPLGAARRGAPGHADAGRAGAAGRLDTRALRDPLTGLPNRGMLVRRVERLSAATGEIALVLVDLDDFRDVNAAIGHAGGDHLLVAVAERVRSAVLEAHGTVVDAAPMVVRLGGDEFAVLVSGDGCLERAAEYAASVLRAIREPVWLAGRRVDIGASIGIARAAGGTDAHDLLRDAEVAMYAAKGAGRGRAVTFDAGMQRAAVERLVLPHELRDALANGGLSVAYQPQVDLATGAVLSAEGLVRWEHPVRGSLPPHRFVPLAERAGLIAAVDDAVLREACRAAAGWAAAGHPLGVAVNVCGRDFEDPGLLARVSAALEESGLDPSRLELEITETLAVSPGGEVPGALGELRRLGVRLAIDDFGTGYSVLARLRDLPADTLKIDQSFVRAIVAADAAAPLIEAIIAMGHGLGMRVVGEGVETAAQLRRLRDLGCDAAQGFLFRPALGAEELLAHARGVGRTDAATVRSVS